MGAYIGIDLGTTYSAVAYLDELGRPIIIDNPNEKDGSNITPSNITISNGEFVVGRVARQLYQDKKDSLGRFKSLMGSSETMELAGKDITPTELSSIVLKAMLKIAEAEVGEISKAVVTIPANFNNEAREATLKAAKLAGLDVDFIINEPTAAALYYAFESGEELSGNYAIYDLGGGTFDISIIRVNGQNQEVLASNGLHKLGGDDFDRAIQELVKQKYKDETGKTLEDYEYTLIQAEEDKISLSTRRKCIAGGGDVVGDGSVVITLQRDDFENAISSLLAQTEMLCEATLGDAGLDPDDIEEIVLVGGSTRIPSVRDCIKRVFGKAPVYPENVDEMVALGAALYAAHKSDKSELNATQKQSLKKIKVKEICNHYFGTIAVSYNANLERDELTNSILIKKGDKIPCSVTEEFSTRYDGQDAISATVTQSSENEPDPEFVKIVWEGELSLPPDRPKGQIIEITYSYDENQVMRCEFVDVKTKKKVEVDLSMSAQDDERSADDEIDRFLVD